jgi:hypothetical protein
MELTTDVIADMFMTADRVVEPKLISHDISVKVASASTPIAIVIGK